MQTIDIGKLAGELFPDDEGEKDVPIIDIEKLARELFPDDDDDDDDFPTSVAPEIFETSWLLIHYELRS